MLVKKVFILLSILVVALLSMMQGFTMIFLAEQLEPNEPVIRYQIKMYFYFLSSLGLFFTDLALTLKWFFRDKKIAH